MKKLAVFCLPLVCYWLAGCASIVGATTSEPIDMDPNRRTMGTMMDDSQLETIAKVNIDKAHPDLKSSPITVTSFNRVILLTGQVKSAELRELAARTVSKLSKVRQVYNELQVQAPTSFLANTNDAWLTTKVKSKLAFNDEARARRIKVLTENGIVYLMGMVPRTEAEHAAEVARSTTGVQKVVLAIEYTDQ
ncbi:BON domain-containing protein [Gilvimarinus sp. F26214L]|uniref:BON domain-containing protein n=1 Tax=Gilvimarinus sp. DZF01 TaxID=3461371 RepID=UPI0040459420